MTFRKIYYLQPEASSSSSSLGHAVLTQYPSNPEASFTLSLLPAALGLTPILWFYPDSTHEKKQLSFSFVSSSSSKLFSKFAPTREFQLELHLGSYSFWLYPNGEMRPSQTNQTVNVAPQKVDSFSYTPPEQSSPSPWDFLSRRFGLIHPFVDKTEAISLTPSEIHKFTVTHRFLEENSFLLHGYYQYRHILWGRKPTTNGSYLYFVGVPGIYHKQEIIVSKMFGFPQFLLPKSSTSSKSSSLKSTHSYGAFGYYIRNITPTCIDSPAMPFV